MNAGFSSTDKGFPPTKNNRTTIITTLQMVPYSNALKFSQLRHPHDVIQLIRTRVTILSSFVASLEESVHEAASQKISNKIKKGQLYIYININV